MCDACSYTHGARVRVPWRDGRKGGSHAACVFAGVWCFQGNDWQNKWLRQRHVAPHLTRSARCFPVTHGVKVVAPGSDVHSEFEVLNAPDVGRMDLDPAHLVHHKLVRAAVHPCRSHDTTGGLLIVRVCGRARAPPSDKNRRPGGGTMAPTESQASCATSQETTSVAGLCAGACVAPSVVTETATCAPLLCFAAGTRKAESRRQAARERGRVPCVPGVL